MLVGVLAHYARVRGLRVAAFEPSASSYAALVRNVESHGLAGQVVRGETPLPVFAPLIYYMRTELVSLAHDLEGVGVKNAVDAGIREGEVTAVAQQQRRRIRRARRGHRRGVEAPGEGFGAGLVRDDGPARDRLLELGESRIAEFDRGLIPVIRRAGS